MILLDKGNEGPGKASKLKNYPPREKAAEGSFPEQQLVIELRILLDNTRSQW